LEEPFSALTSLRVFQSAATFISMAVQLYVALVGKKPSETSAFLSTQIICDLQYNNWTVHHVFFLFLFAVGGLTSPVRGPYFEPLYVVNKPSDSLQLIISSTDFEDEEEHLESADKVITAGLRTQKLDDETEVKAGSNESKRGLSSSPQTLISEPNLKRCNKITTVPELELRKLERGEVSVFCLSLCVRCAHGPCS